MRIYGLTKKQSQKLYGLTSEQQKEPDNSQVKCKGKRRCRNCGLWKQLRDFYSKESMECKTCTIYKEKKGLNNGKNVNS